MNALWSGSAARRPGEAFAGPGARVGKKPSEAAAEAFNVPVAPYVEGGRKASRDRQRTSSESAADGRGRAMHVILEGEVVRVAADGVRTILKAGESFGEDWLLSDAARAEMALAENAAGRALRREASTSYVASSSYQPVTLEITRTTLRTLWGAEFDDYLRSRHDVAAEARSSGKRRRARYRTRAARRATAVDRRIPKPARACRDARACLILILRVETRAGRRGSRRSRPHLWRRPFRGGHDSHRFPVLPRRGPVLPPPPSRRAARNRRNRRNRGRSSRRSRRRSSARWACPPRSRRAL